MYSSVNKNPLIRRILFLFIALLAASLARAQGDMPKFKVIAFYTAKDDKAHISFVHEANPWFAKMAQQYHFQYDSTKNWDNLNPEFLKQYKVVIFLDTRPEKPEQREAFQKYMEHGGGWMGFHFAAFALTPSEFRSRPVCQQYLEAVYCDTGRRPEFSSHKGSAGKDQIVT
jgi:hypothetical protein